MPYAVSIVPLCECGQVFMARLHKLPNCKYGDDWEWNCVVKREERENCNIAHIEGAKTAPTVEMTYALAAKLIELGYTRWSRERWKNGKKRVIERKLFICTGDI